MCLLALFYSLPRKPFDSGTELGQLPCHSCGFKDGSGSTVLRLLGLLASLVLAVLVVLVLVTTEEVVGSAKQQLLGCLTCLRPWEHVGCLGQLQHLEHLGLKEHLELLALQVHRWPRCSMCPSNS